MAYIDLAEAIEEYGGGVGGARPGRLDAARGGACHDRAVHTRQPFVLHVAEHYRSALALLWQWELKIEVADLRAMRKNSHPRSA
jgi:hypothetical protein